MSDKRETLEAFNIANAVMAALINFPIAPGIVGSNFRSAVGKFLTNFYDLVNKNTVGTEMLNCFETARFAGATLSCLNEVREAALANDPLHNLGNAVVNASVIFSFSEQCLIIAQIEFVSRIQVDDLMDEMAVIIEEIKLSRSNDFQLNDYRNIIATSALLFQHLSATERLLPRVVTYNFPVHLPSLYLANRIYGDGSRSEELIAENKTVHPLFMQRDIIALSS